MNLEDKLSAALERLAQGQRALLWARAYPLGLTPTQALLLLHLARRPEGVGPLAEYLALSPPTVSEALQSLEAKGYLLREKDPTDQRRRVLRISPQGQALAQRLSHWDAPLRKAWQALEAPERLLQDLLFILAHLVQEGLMGESGMCPTCCHYSYTHGQAYCRLLEQPLPPAELRLFCPDHTPQSAPVPPV